MYSYEVTVTIRDCNLAGNMKWEATASAPDPLRGKMERCATGSSASGAARAAVEWLIQDLMQRDHRRGGR